MAAFEPFEPARSGTQVIALGAGAATSQTIQIPTSIGNGNYTLLATLLNANPAGGTAIQAYVRVSTEASTSITATATDCPMVAVAGAATSVRLFASANPAGSYNIAVVVTVTPSLTGSQIWFTPGQGGVL